MPAKAGFARGYMFTGSLVAKRPQGHAPAWDFHVETIHEGPATWPTGRSYDVQFEKGRSSPSTTAATLRGASASASDTW